MRFLVLGGISIYRSRTGGAAPGEQRARRRRFSPRREPGRSAVVCDPSDRRPQMAYRFHSGVCPIAPDVVIDTFAMTEMDARSIVQVFGGLAKRVIVLSSMDVYRAYDRFRGVDLGVIDNLPLSEDTLCARRSFPTRNQTTPEDSLLFNYENILVERVVKSQPEMPVTVLRLPCVYASGRTASTARSST